MRTLIPLLAVLIGCPKQAPVAPPAPTTDAAAAPSAPDTPATPGVEALTLETPRPLLLWKATKGDVTNYLLGTCHVPIPLEHALPTKSHAHILTGARVVMGEVDLPNTDPFVMMPLLRGDTRMSEHMEEAAFRRLVQGAPPDMTAPLLDRMAPWSAVSSSGRINRQPTNPGTILDLAALHASAQQGAEMKYLETLEEQITMMTSFNDAFLASVATEAGVTAGKESLTRVVHACIAGDIDALAAVMSGGDDSMMPELIDKRNRNWMPMLTAEFEQGNAVAAVGAGHMTGPASLLTLLEAEGYTLTQESTNVPPTLSEADLIVPPTLDPYGNAEHEDAWRTAASEMFTANMCNEANPMFSCLFSSVDQCRTTIESDISLCIQQFSPRLSSQVGEPATVQALAQCSMSGAIFDIVGPDFPWENPVCKQIGDAMQAAAKQTLSGQ